MLRFETGKKVIHFYLKHLESKPGVYHMLDEKENILYIGKAKDLYARVSNYISDKGLTNRIQRMVAQTRQMKFIYTNTETEALLLESNLIKKHLPPFNVMLRDDKSFPYIEITNDDFPILKKYRGKKLSENTYFGPFPSVSSVEKTLVVLQKVFKLRNCNNSFFSSRVRPCLQYQIKRCSAPCVGKISSNEYQEQKKDVIFFLKGKSKEIQSKLSKEMSIASENLEFEIAGRYRDRIKALSSIQFTQDINLRGVLNADFVAAYQQESYTAIEVFFYRMSMNYGSKIYFPKYSLEISLEEVLSAFLGQFYINHQPPSEIYISHGIRDKTFLSNALTTKILIPKKGGKKQILLNCVSNAKKALERKLSEKQSLHERLLDVQKKLNLKNFPSRIEIYDNSHLFGKYAYGAMVFHDQDGFDKQRYRLYKIKTDIVSGDDFGMMREVFSRRFRNIDKDVQDTLPKLVLIDGGRGHLNTIYELFKNKNLFNKIDFVAISKGHNRNAGEEEFHKLNEESFQLSKQDSCLFFLQKLRDEAHRFAIARHKKTRIKNLDKSALDQIDGVGPKRKKQLLNYFGSIKTISEAGIKDLKILSGISDSLAEKIYYYFHEK